jgi:DNA-binding transcriptional LysR family regulator
MGRAPDWDLYQSLHAVLRTGSLSAAARDLGLTQPTLGRHVEQLEQSLGLPLFTRSPQGLKPTDFALRLGAYLDSMAAAAEAALREVSGEVDAVAGVVRVTASEVIGGEVLPPILARFREAHPLVVIELALSNATEDLLRREADIAVRMVRPAQAALIAKHVGSIQLGLHAHRDYLARHGTPQSLADLMAGHSIVGFDKQTASIRSLQGQGIPLSREMFAFRSDSDLAQLAAIRAGFGVGVCQYGLAQRDPNLVALLPDALSFELDTWIAMHEDLRNSRRMRLMFDHLVEGLSAYAARSSSLKSTAR